LQFRVGHGVVDDHRERYVFLHVVASLPDDEREGSDDSDQEKHYGNGNHGGQVRIEELGCLDFRLFAHGF
jgi:hypothetical protein